jgi:dihydroorotase
MVGLESALPVVQTALVDTGLLDWADVARVLSNEPARIGRLNGHSHSFEDGAPANIALVDPAASSVFSLDRLHGKSRNTPYEGVTLSGSVRWTYHHGFATLRDGVLAAPDETAAASREREYAAAGVNV